MRRPSDHDVVADDPPRDVHRQVVLTEVQHVRAGRQRQVRPVVHREQRTVAGARLGDDLEVGQLLARLQTLLPQLDDVDATGERRVDELREVGPHARAQVEAGGGQALPASG